MGCAASSAASDTAAPKPSNKQNDETAPTQQRSAASPVPSVAASAGSAHSMNRSRRSNGSRFKSIISFTHTASPLEGSHEGMSSSHTRRSSWTGSGSRVRGASNRASNGNMSEGIYFNTSGKSVNNGSRRASPVGLQAAAAAGNVVSRSDVPVIVHDEAFGEHMMASVDDSKSLMFATPSVTPRVYAATTSSPPNHIMHQASASAEGEGLMGVASPLCPVLAVPPSVENDPICASNGNNNSRDANTDSHFPKNDGLHLEQQERDDLVGSYTRVVSYDNSIVDGTSLGALSTGNNGFMRNKILVDEDITQFMEEGTDGDDDDELETTMPSNGTTLPASVIPISSESGGADGGTTMLRSSSSFPTQHHHCNHPNALIANENDASGSSAFGSPTSSTSRRPSVTLLLHTDQTALLNVAHASNIATPKSLTPVEDRPHPAAPLGGLERGI